MKKNHPNSPEPTIPPHHSLADHLEEHPVVHWFSKNGLSVVYMVIGAIFLLMLIYRYYGGSAKSQQDFYEAESSLQKLQKFLGIAGRFGTLRTILNAHPELHPKYDGLIAQVLLNEGNVQEAKPFAELAIHRTESENAPYFTDFAQTTLLIADKQYSEALQRAQALSQKMLEQETFQKENRLLFAYNLLRIGMLQQELGAYEDANKTWKEWMGYAEKANQTASAATMNTNGFLLLTRAFSEGKLTLLNYMTHQENAPNKK